MIVNSHINFSKVPYINDFKGKIPDVDYRLMVNNMEG